jgi:hypothetical protein
MYTVTHRSHTGVKLGAKQLNIFGFNSIVNLKIINKILITALFTKKMTVILK